LITPTTPDRCFTEECLIELAENINERVENKRKKDMQIKNEKGETIGKLVFARVDDFQGQFGLRGDIELEDGVDPQKILAAGAIECFLNKAEDDLKRVRYFDPDLGEQS